MRPHSSQLKENRGSKKPLKLPKKGHRGIKKKKWNEDQMKTGLRLLDAGWSVRKAAAAVDVPHMSLSDYSKGKTKDRMGRKPILTREVEATIADRIADNALRGFPYTASKIRSFVFNFCRLRGMETPFNKSKGQAGTGWFYRFMARNQKLSLRKPENVSRARAAAFNQDNVQQWHDKISQHLNENGIKFEASDVYNADETGFTVVPDSKERVVGVKGAKNIPRMSSGERGTLTTMVGAMSASGQFLPPWMIHPGTRLLSSLMAHYPKGTGHAMSTSGYIDRDLFTEYFDFFLTHRCPPKPGNSTILFVDGHGSHVYNPAVLAKAIEENVVIICFPAHCTNKMQPCDVSFFGPLKRAFRPAVNDWMSGNMGQICKDVNLGELVGIAWDKVVKPETVIKSFRICGLYPFVNVFDKNDFKMSELFYGPVEPRPSQTSDGSSARSSPFPVPTDEIENDYTPQGELGEDFAMVDSDIWLNQGDPFFQGDSLPQREASPELSPVLHDLDATFPLIELGSARQEIQVKRRSVMSLGGVLTSQAHLDYATSLSEKRVAREKRTIEKENAAGFKRKAKPKSFAIPASASTSDPASFITMHTAGAVSRNSYTLPSSEASASTAVPDWTCQVCNVRFNGDDSGVDWLRCRSCETCEHEKCGYHADVFFYCKRCNDNPGDDWDQEYQ